MKPRRIASNICLVLRYYLRYAPQLFWGQTVFTIFVSAIGTIQGPITTKYLLDALTNAKPLKEVLGFLVIMTLLVIVRHVFACYIVEYLDTIANITIQEKLLKEFYQKASRLDLEYYETPEFYNDYVWAAQQVSGQFRRIFGSYNTLTARLSEAVFVGGVMAVLNPVLLVFALSMSVIGFVVQQIHIKLRYAANMEAKPVERERDYAKRIFYLSDYAKEIRLSRIYEVILARFVNANEKLCGIWRKYGRKRFCISLASSFSMGLFGTLGMYAYLAYEVLVTHALSVGDFSALTQSAGRFTNRLGQVLNVISGFAEQSIYMDKFRRFMEYESKIEGQKGECPERDLKPLTFRNVSFSYHGESKPSLKNVSMVFKPYEKTVIVGYNGAGKTTLIKLLLRLYDPSEGEILLGDRNIKEFDTKEYRKEFAVIFQDYQIFAAALGENAAMDEVRGEDRERVENALCQAGLEGVLKKLPLGIDTPLTKEFEQGGIEFSGGERQKAALARTFFRNTHFAIMDEPSSALDPAAEYHLFQNMLKAAENRTVIFISHRLSAAVMADKIYMFEQGKIVEQGNHEELMAMDGRYAEMFRKQSANYAETKRNF